MELAPAFPWRARGVELFQLETDHVTSEYVAWLRDPLVTRFLESRFQAHDEESTRAYVGRMRAAADSLLLGIRSEELGRHVGNIKLGPIDRNHGLAEIGVMIGDRAAWGRGAATGAIALLCEIAGRQLELRKVTAGCYATNAASRRAFEKAGFHVEAVRERHFLVEGRPEDLVLLARYCDQ